MRASATAAGLVLATVAVILMVGCPARPPSAETPPASEDEFAPATPDDPDAEEPKIEPLAVAGALEGEGLRVVAKTGGDTLAADMADWEGAWSRDQQLWWFDAEAGDTLTLSFDVPSGGRYEVVAKLSEAPDYGRFTLAIDDREPSEAVDLHAETVQLAEDVPLGRMWLEPGEHRLLIAAIGPHEGGPTPFGLGLDYVLLR